MRLRAASVALFLLFLAPLAARQDKTDEFITAQLREQNIPGLALAIAKDGKVIKAAGYGYADLERKIPITPETVLKIASVSKQCIATGIMLLVQDGSCRSPIRSANTSPTRPRRGRASRFGTC
jgi:CubicO group peptidase (beta-lactamase class C family)